MEVVAGVCVGVCVVAGVTSESDRRAPTSSMRPAVKIENKPRMNFPYFFFVFSLFERWRTGRVCFTEWEARLQTLNFSTQPHRAKAARTCFSGLQIRDCYSTWSPNGAALLLVVHAVHMQPGDAHTNRLGVGSKQASHARI